MTAFAYFRQSYQSELLASAFDTPLFAGQDRTNVRNGAIGSITHSFHGHTIKAGLETSRVSLREFFTFAVTDLEGAPLEVDEDELEDLRSRPGGDLVDFERRRVKAWTTFDFAAGWDSGNRKGYRSGRSLTCKTSLEDASPTTSAIHSRALTSDIRDYGAQVLNLSFDNIRMRNVDYCGHLFRVRQLGRCLKQSTLANRGQ